MQDLWEKRVYSTSAQIPNCILKLAFFPAVLLQLSLSRGAVHKALSRRRDRGGEAGDKGVEECFPGEQVQLLEQQCSPSCCLSVWGKGINDHPRDSGTGGESVGGLQA